MPPDKLPHKKPWRPAGSGAQRGLQMKMDYWKQKDFQTEYNILVGQAFNMAVPDKGDIRTRAKEYFKLLIDLRKDKELQRLFEDYKQPIDAERIEEEELNLS